MQWLYRYRYVFAIGAVCSLLISHSINEVTGRFQLLFLPEPQLKIMAVKEYKQYKRDNVILDPAKNEQAAMVERVGYRLTHAVESLYASNKEISQQLKQYEWEYCVIESSDVNAWCLPGGKIIVNSGLIQFAKTESALAIIMGHEIAHALARHGNERMSYSMLVSGIAIVGEVILYPHLCNQMVFRLVFPKYGRYHFLLPKMRDQEMEADKYGLIFAAYAGYDPRASIALWQRMHTGKSKDSTDLNSTHPSEIKRVKALKTFMPIALEFYQKK